MLLWDPPAVPRAGAPSSQGAWHFDGWSECRVPRAAAMTDRVRWKIELVSKVVFSSNGVNGVVPLVTEGLTEMVVSSFFVH